MPIRPPAAWAGLGGTALALAGYAAVEPYLYRLERRAVPVRRGALRLSVLHLSDTHLRAANRRLLAFLGRLAGEIGTPDLVLATGDMIEDDSGIDPLVEALAAIQARLGRFYVLGSHDYYQSESLDVKKYLGIGRGVVKAPRADTRRLESGLRAKGWLPLTNAAEVLDTPHGAVRLAGVDDPYLRRHDTAHIERAAGDALAIGLVHAPDVVSEWALNGFDLVVAGHTHGGQVRLPGLGAVVTNCSLPSALAAGLHPIGGTWLHVSRGLGAGKFTPVRFACAPEATLLELVPSSA